MHKVDSYGATAQNEFTNGGSGVARTRLEQKFMNALQRELVAIPPQAGIALSDTDDQQIIQSVPLTVATIAALRLCPVPPVSAGKKVAVFVRGSAADGDGVGALFFWSSASASADDGVTVVRPSTNPATGRWLRAPLGYATTAGSATTAASATNSSQLGGVAAASYATQAFVNAAIAAIVNSSPAALDTLSELAAALGNDANFATNVINALAAKAALNGPAFTNPTANTQAVGTNSALLATTAYVLAAMLGGPSQTPTNVSGSRSAGTIYTNPTGRPIEAIVAVSNVGTAVMNINGVQGPIRQSDDAADIIGLRATVPKDGNYQVNCFSGAYISYWYEMR